MHQCPRRCDSLALASRQAQSTRTDQSLRTVGHLVDVIEHRRQFERHDQPLFVDDPESDVVGHRVGDELWNLRQERSIGRDQERGAVREVLAIPHDVAGDVGLMSETEQCP